MENLSHSLVGAAIAELALPRTAGPAQRRLFFVTGVVAANLPDADLLYTRITPPPLGYMLHHRGHTHTLAGVAALALVIGLLAFAPGVRAIVAEWRGRFWALAGAALLSHLVLDAWNSYGIHPFYPFDNRWYYGDAVNIVDPWLWAILGVAAVANTRSRIGRWLLGGLLAVLPLLGVRFGAMAALALVPIALIAAALAAAGWRRTAAWRSGTALGATAVYVSGLFAVSAAARRDVARQPPPDLRGHIVDVILRPGLANPLCWNAIAIELKERDDEFVLRRAVVSPVPGFQRPAGCTTDAHDATSTSANGAVRWTAAARQPLGRLRALYRDDCSVRAWMQFGRAPALDDGRIADDRFGDPGGSNFTGMPLTPRTDACPPHLTAWVPPRADLLGDDAGSRQE